MVSKHGAARGCGDRIARGGLQGESRRMVHDVLRPDHRRERQAPAQSLAEDDQIGLEVLVLETMHLSAAPETHFDLIDDDLDAVAPAPLLDSRQESRRRHDDAAVGHDRLDENGRDLVRRRGRRKLIVEELQHRCRAEGRTIGIRIGQQQ